MNSPRALLTVTTLLSSVTLAPACREPDRAPDVALDARADASDAHDARAGTAAELATVLRVHYPAGAHTIAIRGAAGPFSWARGVAAVAGADDVWTFRTTALTAATEWKPLLDDTAAARGPNYHVEPGQTVDVYPRFVQVSGRVLTLFPAFHSTALGNDRVVWAYVPPTHIENPRARFPVVYMQDGQDLFDASRALGGHEWQVDEAMDRGAEDGSIAEAIVVAPASTAQRIDEYTPTHDASTGAGGQLRQYLRMLRDELRPAVDAALRTQTGPEHTVIVGSSLGGLASVYAGLWEPGTFGRIGAMSPASWWDGEIAAREVRAGAGASARPGRVYLDSGDSGSGSDSVTETARLAQAYRDAGYLDEMTLRYVRQTGATHDATYWAQRVPGALGFLLGPGR